MWQHYLSFVHHSFYPQVHVGTTLRFAVGTLTYVDDLPVWVIHVAVVAALLVAAVVVVIVVIVTRRGKQNAKTEQASDEYITMDSEGVIELPTVRISDNMDIGDEE